MFDYAGRCASRVPVLCFLSVTAIFAQVWTAQGPGPTRGGQSEGIPNNPVSGAMNAVATDPTDGNTIYVATVNGGVWKTTNGLAASPTWTQLTDQLLPALSMASLAVSPLSNTTIYAGTGSTSSDGFDGGPGIGLAKSIDGGATWSVLAAATFTGKRIVSVVPTTLTVSGQQVVLAATLFDTGGLYRSTDGGSTFTRISGMGGSGLPNGGVSRIAADPVNTNRFYAGVPSNYLNSGSAGVYISNDGGQTWVPMNGTIPAAILNNSLRILLSVSPASPQPVYAMFISNNVASGIAAGHLSGVFRSPNQGATWTSLGVPSPETFPGGQGVVHGAIIAHPSNVNVAFMSGDRQDSPFTNANGCNNFSGNVFRWDTSAWANAVCNGANAGGTGTSPHADSRNFAYDSNGNLIQVNDGGMVRLTNPDGAAGARSWSSMNNNIQPSEMHSAAYDPLSGVVFGGTQDNGTTVQSTPGNTTWDDLLGGDGGRVAVDTDQTAHAGTTIRYTSFQGLGFFNRTNWNSINTRIGGFTPVTLNITSGTGSGQTVFAFDPNIQFYNPYVLNKITPSRMLLGTASIYESSDMGATVANLGFTGFFIQSLAYGGRLNGSNFADVFYVAAGATLRHRTTVGGLISTITYPGSTIRAVGMDPQNYQKVFVVDSLSRVWGSFDEGVSWVELTANLPALTNDVRSIEVFSSDINGRTTRLLVGGRGGVFQMRRPGAAGTSWSLLGTGMPNALVFDLHYDFTSNVLLASTLGRGAWTTTNPFGLIMATESPASYQPGVFVPLPIGPMPPGMPPAFQQ